MIICTYSPSLLNWSRLHSSGTISRHEGGKTTRWEDFALAITLITNRNASYRERLDFVFGEGLLKENMRWAAETIRCDHYLKNLEDKDGRLAPSSSVNPLDTQHVRLTAERGEELPPILPALF